MSLHDQDALLQIFDPPPFQLWHPEHHVIMVLRRCERGRGVDNNGGSF
jgi:hypothetical protein